MFRDLSAIQPCGSLLPLEPLARQACMEWCFVYRLFLVFPIRFVATWRRASARRFVPQEGNSDFKTTQGSESRNYYCPFVSFCNCSMVDPEALSFNYGGPILSISVWSGIFLGDGSYLFGPGFFGETARSGDPETPRTTDNSIHLEERHVYLANTLAMAKKDPFYPKPRRSTPHARLLQACCSSFGRCTLATPSCPQPFLSTLFK